MKRHPGITRASSGRYRVRVQVTDPRTGTRKEADRWLTGSLAQAIDLREVLRAELRGEGPRSPGSLASYAIGWAERRALRLRPSSRSRYALTVAHIVADLGHLRVGELRPGDVEDWLVAQVGRGDAPATVNGRLRVLRSICRAAAADWGVPDPTATVQALREGESSRRPLGAAELRRLLELVEREDPARYPLLLLLALTGLRWGEATALRYEDLDEAGGVLRVARAHWRGHVGETKAGRPRTYPLVPELLEVLREHRRRRMAAQAPGHGEGWCFAVRRRGGGWGLPAPSSWGKCLPRWCEAAGVRVVSPHAFRRSWVDLARQSGAHLVVARSLVGHAGDRVHERYSSVATDEQRAVAGAVVRLVRGGGET